MRHCDENGSLPGRRLLVERSLTGAIDCGETAPCGVVLLLSIGRPERRFSERNIIAENCALSIESRNVNGTSAASPKVGGFPVQPLLLTFRDGSRISEDPATVRPEVEAAIALCEA